VMPFAYSDGTCPFCHEGLTTACVHGGFFGSSEEVGGAQAEAVRIPLADGTLYALPVREDHALAASLLTLSDVMGTGHHAAVTAPIQFSSQWATNKPCSPPSASRERAAQLAASAFLITPESLPGSRRSTRISRSAVAQPQSVPTSTNFCPTCSKGALNQDAF